MPVPVTQNLAFRWLGNLDLPTAIHFSLLCNLYSSSLQKHQAYVKQFEVEKVRADHEERRKTMGAEVKQHQERAKFEDQLARRRYDDQLAQQVNISQPPTFLSLSPSSFSIFSSSSFTLSISLHTLLCVNCYIGVH